MRRKVESKFQTKMLNALKGQGLLTQKFNDLFAEGIPDTLIQVPISRPLPRLPSGMWVEVKALDPSDMPKRRTSSLPKKFMPSPEQRSFMRAWQKGVFPCMMILNCPLGWFACPESALDEVFSKPYPELPYMKDKITYASIFESYSQWKSDS